jgi:hypothetical protein
VTYSLLLKLQFYNGTVIFMFSYLHEVNILFHVSSTSSKYYFDIHVRNTKVCQWLATSRWFSPCPPVSSINKTDRHDITEIVLKVALNTVNQTNKHRELVHVSMRYPVVFLTCISKFELTTSVVIGTDCIGSCKSNYHTITATTTPYYWSICPISFTKK